MSEELWSHFVLLLSYSSNCVTTRLSPMAPPSLSVSESSARLATLANLEKKRIRWYIGKQGVTGGVTDGKCGLYYLVRHGREPRHRDGEEGNRYHQLRAQ